MCADAPTPATIGPMATHVTLTGELAGDYVIDDVLDDGRIIIRPDTSADAIRRRAGVEWISDTDFERIFGHLPTDDDE